MHWVFLVVYVLLFAAFLAAAVFWRKKQRKDRAPFPENARLLRGPGESLRRKLAELDARLASELLFAFVVPLLVGLGIALIATRVDNDALQVVLVFAALAGLLASLGWVVLRLVRTAEHRANVWLGCFGERIVAENLEPLRAQGFRVFHDVPAGDPKHPFNIDHVVVGPSGVFAIETKTRRKGRARAGFAEHQIIYDGNVLAYPWGEDRHGLDQAARQADWLRASLEQLLGQSVRVQPILTFPGWMVITRAPGAVTVLNPKQIPSAVALRGTPALDEHRIDLVSRQLDARCRDVEF